jgi:DNA-binding HxlR family transcriptional regulator
MQRTPLHDVACSIARTVDLVGEWWTPLIVRDLFAGLTRFEDLRRDLGIASNVLSARLERLEENAIVERRRYQERPPRDEYVLTEKGRDLFPILATILAWGDRWLAGDDGPPALFIHKDCGQVTTAVVVCSHCGECRARAAGRGRAPRSSAAISNPMAAESTSRQGISQLTNHRHLPHAQRSRLPPHSDRGGQGWTAGAEA